MRINPATQAIGCISAIVNLGSLISGIYQGLAEARGTHIDPDTLKLIRWGPITLSGVLGIPAAMTMGDRRSIDDMAENMPEGMDRTQLEGCIKGCGPVGFPILGAAINIGFQYVGYLVGKAIY